MALTLGLSDVSSLNWSYTLFHTEYMHHFWISQKWCALRSLSYWGQIMLPCLLTSAVNLHHLVKVMSLELLHCKVAIFLFVINILRKIYWDYANIPFLLKLLLIILACIVDLAYNSYYLMMIFFCPIFLYIY